MQTSGWIVGDKPIGLTSRQMVDLVARRINHGPDGRRVPKGERVKVGHCGTLDPLATGVLVIAVGRATRMTDLVHGTAKRYRGAFRLGCETPSGDLEFKPTPRDDLPMPDDAAIHAAAATMIGDVEQTPPAYSAVHVDGRRAYQRIREGEDVEMPSRTVRIDRCDVTRCRPPDFELDVVCGNGTYLRTLGIDIARGAGSTAVMTSLRRIAVGGFTIDDAVDADRIRDVERPLPLMPLRSIADSVATTVVTEDVVEHLRHGRRCPAPNASSIGPDEHRLVVDQSGDPVAIVRRDSGDWKPVKVFAS